MKRRVLSVACVLILLIFVHAKAPQRAYACSCGGPHSVRSTLEYDDAVFYGSVIANATVTPRPGHENEAFRQRALTFRVLSSWKGSFGPEVTVYTGLGGRDCGVALDVGDNALVIADASEDSLLQTATCHYFISEQGIDVFRALGPGNPPLDPQLMASHGAPAQPTPPPEPDGMIFNWTLVVTLALAAVLAFLVIRRTRQRRSV
jgi:hypothetical protein